MSQDIPLSFIMATLGACFRGARRKIKEGMLDRMGTGQRTLGNNVCYTQTSVCGGGGEAHVTVIVSRPMPPELLEHILSQIYETCRTTGAATHSTHLGKQPTRH